MGWPPETLGSDTPDPSPRRRWTWALLAAAAAVLVATALIQGDGIAEDPEAPARPETTAASSPLEEPGTRVDNLLQPETRKAGEKTVIRVAFPDGQRAEIRYPSHLVLAELGVRPYATAGVGEERAVFTFPPGGEADLPGGPLRTFTGHRGRPVKLWQATGAALPNLDSRIGRDLALLFRFGDWHLLAMDDRGAPMTFEGRQSLARHLRGRVTKNGYLILDAAGPVELGAPGDWTGERPLGPQLRFGGHHDHKQVWVGSEPDCEKDRPAPGWPRLWRSTCIAGFWIGASGEDDFVRDLFDGVRIRPQ